MAEEQQTYKGRDIRISTEAGATQLSIDGRNIDIVQDEDSGQYGTSYLPYRNYSSVVELAQQVIDYVPDFRS
ncbi:MAG: hypothetical protein OEU26_22745 [Candidatus Tectomicrobia bacterium]|nr:hypothetical protein [Candidatus Tectomicrobia bacterium]